MGKFKCLNIRYINTIEYNSARKKEGNLPFATAWMNLENIKQSEISQPKKKIPYDFTHMWTLMNKINK